MLSLRSSSSNGIRCCLYRNPEVAESLVSPCTTSFCCLPQPLSAALFLPTQSSTGTQNQRRNHTRILQTKRSGPLCPTEGKYTGTPDIQGKKVLTDLESHVVHNKEAPRGAHNQPIFISPHRDAARQAPPLFRSQSIGYLLLSQIQSVHISSLCDRRQSEG